MSGQTGRELIDRIDSLDFSKCFGSTESGDTSSISVGFEQIKKNAIAHLMDQPFVNQGDTGSPLAGVVIARTFEDYMKDLSLTILPYDITFLKHNGRYSSILRRQCTERNTHGQSRSDSRGGSRQDYRSRSRSHSRDNRSRDRRNNHEQQHRNSRTSDYSRSRSRSRSRDYRDADRGRSRRRDSSRSRDYLRDEREDQSWDNGSRHHQTSSSSSASSNSGSTTIREVMDLTRDSEENTTTSNHSLATIGIQAAASSNIAALQDNDDWITGEVYYLL